MGIKNIFETLSTKLEKRKPPLEMQEKEKNFSRTFVPFATQWAPTVPDQLKGAYGNAPQVSDGFAYSGALAGKGKWNEKTLDKYLKSPADYAPGNLMAFSGVPAPKDRADLIAYLKDN